MPVHWRRLPVTQRRRPEGRALTAPRPHRPHRAAVAQALAAAAVLALMLLAPASAQADSPGWSGSVTGTYTERAQTINWSRTQDATTTATSDGSTANSDGTITFAWNHREQSAPCEQGGVAYSAQTAGGTKPAHQAIFVRVSDDGTYTVATGGDAVFDYYNDYYDCATHSTSVVSGGPYGFTAPCDDHPQALPAGWDGLTLSGDRTCRVETTTGTQVWHIVWHVTRAPDSDHDGVPDPGSGPGPGGDPGPGPGGDPGPGPGPGPGSGKATRPTATTTASSTRATTAPTCPTPTRPTPTTTAAATPARRPRSTSPWATPTPPARARASARC